ncbi:MAG: caspase family protein [Stenomitos frigidus ULC029]
MGLTRRHFLQRSGLALAAFGASDLMLSSIAQRYQGVLAEPTRRKLALLIGINQYRQTPLYGCGTDVELQRELLIHRFGFQPGDILTLTDQQATRKAITTAFVEHLIGQARSGDVVVFHFSGYGGQVALGTTPETVQKSLVTIDEPLTQGEKSIVNDLLAETLLLLLRSLPTDRVTTILDASYAPPTQPLQGNLRLRSRPRLTVAHPSDAELAFQESLLRQTNLDRPRLAVQRRSGQMPGVVLTAAGTGQWATEAQWDGFSAGLFTYALTQQLWQATPATALRMTLQQATEQMGLLAHHVQQPQLSGQMSKDHPLTPYHLLSVPNGGADGVVVRFEESGKAVRLWLGGLSASVLEQYEANSLLSLVDESGVNRDRLLQIVSRDGLFAKAKLYPASAENSALIETAPALHVGQFVREAVRVLPSNIGLTIALDSSLARIERVDAISAISAMPHILAVNAGEPADYLFSKTQAVQPTQIAALPATLPALLTNKAAVAQSSYALFSPGRIALPHTAGEGGEAVKMAVKRLAPKLQTLLAVKLLNLTVNETASHLAVRATLTVVTPKARGLMQRQTSAIAQLTPSPQTLSPVLPPETAQLVSLSIGSRIQYQLENQSGQAVYFLLLHLDSNGDLVSLDSPLARLSSTLSPPPTRATGGANDATIERDYASNIIAPQETLTLPQLSASFQWLVSGPTGLATTYMLCSSAPFKQTMELLDSAQASDTPSLKTLAKPLEVVQALLQDLHQASDRVEPTAGEPLDSVALNMNVWASLRFVYQVV